MKPLFISEEEIPEDFISGEKEIYIDQLKDSGKPEKIVEQIVQGKLAKYKAEISLLSQPWIKNQDLTIRDYIGENVAKIGENIKIKRFARYDI